MQAATYMYTGTWKYHCFFCVALQERYEVAFSPEMEKACMQYYSEHYREHFATPVMRDVLACIPQINIWDDHDIFDGWGSYPEPLQMCHVFQGMSHQQATSMKALQVPQSGLCSPCQADLKRWCQNMDCYGDLPCCMDLVNESKRLRSYQLHARVLTAKKDAAGCFMVHHTRANDCHHGMSWDAVMPCKQ